MHEAVHVQHQTIKSFSFMRLKVSISYLTVVPGIND